MSANKTVEDYVGFLANTLLEGEGLIEVPDWLVEMGSQLDKEGFNEKEAVEAEMDRIKSEKEAKRKNDPEGYKNAIDQYDRLILRGCKCCRVENGEMLGLATATLVIDLDDELMEELHKAVECLYEYEVAHRKFYFDIEKSCGLTHNVISYGKKHIGMDQIVEAGLEGETLEDMQQTVGVLDKCKDTERTEK